MLSFGGRGGSEYFIKGALTFSIITMLLMTSFLTVFLPDKPEVKGYEEEMNELLGAYYDVTGSEIQNEQIWGLTGIYTPYGTDKDGRPSSKQMVLLDGWIAGDRVTSYTPTQYAAGNLPGANLSYTVTYESDKGLYYYSAHGSDLGDITDTEVVTDSSGTHRVPGTLYTSVTMDKGQQSNQFFTVGNKQEMENGTFFYNYTGYRYCFQALSDYYYNQSTPITHTNTSLSLIWYSYAGGYDSGISGQMVLTGSDSGVAYITAQQIVNSFNSANFTSKFTMTFNGIDMNIYIQLSPYAITNGWSVADCYDRGWWSVLVTSPSVSASSNSHPFDSINPEKVFDLVIHLLTFQSEDYGLTGISKTIAETVFSVSLYTTLIAITLTVGWPMLLVMGALALFQMSSITDLWPW